MDLSVIGKSAPHADQVRELKGGDDIIQIVRDVATTLRPAALDLASCRYRVARRGVSEAQRHPLSRQGRETARSIPRGPANRPVPHPQESLTNISRHASAGNVEISLGAMRRTSGSTSSDDARVRSERQGRKKTFGLLGMRERVIMLHGR